MVIVKINWPTLGAKSDFSVLYFLFVCSHNARQSKAKEGVELHWLMAPLNVQLHPHDLCCESAAEQWKKPGISFLFFMLRHYITKTTRLHLCTFAWSIKHTKTDSSSLSIGGSRCWHLKLNTKGMFLNLLAI